MLQETNKLLNRLKEKSQDKYIFWKKIKYKLKKYKKHIKISIICIFTFTILFFPKFSGDVIGTWLNDFFVTIIEKTTEK